MTSATKKSVHPLYEKSIHLIAEKKPSAQLSSPSKETYMAQTICVGFCDDCYIQGYCQAEIYYIVSMAEIENDAFRLDAGNDVVDLIQGIPNLKCAMHIADWYAGFNGWFKENKDDAHETFVNTDALLDINDSWFRDSFRHKRETPIGLRPENREALRALFTIMRAMKPATASLWGVRPANDNPTT